MRQRVSARFPAYHCRVPTRVALADDNLLVREGLEQVLATETEIDVVASCADLPSLLKAVETGSPDVVVTDIRMPPSQTDEGIQAATLLRRTHPEVGVIVLSQYADPSYALTLLELGSESRGYMLKERVHDRAQLVAAIETVAEGGSVIDPSVVDVLVTARSRAAASPLTELTPREVEVLAAIAQGKSNGAISRVARPHEAGSRKAHQLNFPETRAHRRRGCQQACQGRPAFPRRRRRRARGFGLTDTPG